jgi:hypothetical protein
MSRKPIEAWQLPPESGCASHLSRLWKIHEFGFEHDALVVGLLTAAS